MTKMFGIILLILGVIIAASAGIRLGETEYQTTVAEGRAALLDAGSIATAAPVPAATRLEDWIGSAGVMFLAGLVLLTVGAVIGRVAIGRDGESETTADGHDFMSTLASLDKSIAQILEQFDAESLEETRIRIDEALEKLVLPMIDARGVLQRRFGLGGAALVLGPLSGAERQLNRAWSALVDGHAPEAERSLAAATAELDLAQRALEELHEDTT